jgi:putative endonuclease
MADERPRATPVRGPARRPAPGPRQDSPPDPTQYPTQNPTQGPRLERQVAFRTGISAESRAAALLIAKGFRILARRWRSPVGEIDIIARRRSLLVFVEVKARDTLDDAAWSVTERQRSRIIAAAEAWLARNADDRIQDIRFDAMLVAPGRIPRHIAAAFDAST